MYRLYGLKNCDTTRTADMDRPKALELMLEQPALIKRPLLAGSGELVLGFSDDDYARFVADRQSIE